ncbi:hypothetical protein [Pseudoalteromonas xiamenensis]|uniref:Transmembrane protein n=1 Tax=Pseudoalteromonas xiamenensis TaxID=882626 RepID=A0A975DJK9_9GAMM|nr:hypothetical protein [Pseudoalteromonas xiamenensis]QTH72963.1 hypothetical protein J5O05_17540 [Pseudoalteromonas xiamenensis]
MLFFLSKEMANIRSILGLMIFLILLEETLFMFIYSAYSVLPSFAAELLALGAFVLLDWLAFFIFKNRWYLTILSIKWLTLSEDNAGKYGPHPVDAPLTGVFLIMWIYSLLTFIEAFAVEFAEFPNMNFFYDTINGVRSFGLGLAVAISVGGFINSWKQRAKFHEVEQQ